MIEIKESFNWLVPEAFKVQDVGKNSVRIKGVALKSNIVSRNKRKYVDEEVKKSARTLTGKPVTINHDNGRIVGNVEWAEYEDGVLEYLAAVKKQPYVDMIRNRDSQIKGVSVQAGYLHNKCVRCGERFYNEEMFRQHMRDAHGIVDGITEVHGIVFDALSLVVDPEAPGVEGTTIELWETLRKSSPLQLLETVTNVKIDEEKYMKKIEGKATVTPTKTIAIGRVKTPILKEQEEEPEEIKPGSHYCQEHPDDARCIEHKKAIHGEDGVKEQEEATVQDQPPEQTVEAPAPCPEGFTYDKESGQCAPQEWPTVDAPSEAPQIVPEATIEVPKVEAPPILAPAPTEGPVLEYAPTPLKLPKKLRLGEPFAGYTDFADCENKNQDKDDPAAYCASIKQKVEGETMKETVGNVYDLLTEIQRKAFIRDCQSAETINRLNEAIAKLSLDIQKLPSVFKKVSDYTKAEKRRIQEIFKANEETQIKHSEGTSKKVKQLETNYGSLHSGVNKLSESTQGGLSKLASAQAKSDVENKRKFSEFEAKVVEQKKDFEKLLALADKNAEERDSKIKTMEQRLKEQEDELDKRKCGPDEHYDEEQDKCMPNQPAEETQKLKETVDKLKIEVENLQEKQKGNFKGQAPKLDDKKKKEPEYYEDPLKKK